ncbi:MAG: hypothetical protein JRH13_13875 [Deltaproteobacteria bacterium]|nr:hypothetical protein [Deltaproteobacteria bacterium]MBW2130440.1 hypothetical protein [Deltaproteobacteria bacterium]MBW2302769.1 hypothetical protein [Deltaproteobacteria bacterium]
MKKKRAGSLPGWVCLLLLVLSFPGVALGGEGIPKVQVPEGVYINLTRDFYEALRDEGGRGPRTYSNDPSAEYLRQIAISTRFMVETNLQILKLQEEILRLLKTQSGSGRK